VPRALYATILTMRDLPGFPPGSILGYCTNVHAGADWRMTKTNLETYARRVKDSASRDEPMGIGLWLAQPAVEEIIAAGTSHEIATACQNAGLVPFSMNGFPFDDFHQPIVKHAVYQPQWDNDARARYTTHLALLLSEIGSPGDEFSISTLPIAWQSDAESLDLGKAIAWLYVTARYMASLHEQTGVLVHLDLEPEPGCVIQRSDDVIRVFEVMAHFQDEDLIHKHIRVCHDICHAAVMFEDQAEMFARYRAAGIQIGKVQISNAIRATLRNLSARERTEALAQLRQFSEDRYLHQTMIRDNEQFRFFDDLPKALNEFGTTDKAGDEWRVHFHVPVYLESFGLLQTTRDSIIECMRLLKDSDVKHWEVETYAWKVLPKELQVDDLAEGIAKELMWVKEQARRIHEELGGGKIA